MSDVPTYVLEREFDAPRHLVWRTWTEPELLSHWYGPGVETVIHKLDVQPGGTWLNEMKWGGNSNYERMEYTEVDAPARLVWLHAIVDSNWAPTANPMMPDWPSVLLTTVTFTEKGDKTVLKLTWQPHEASDAEMACFKAAMAGLDKGWGSGMDMLAEMLAEMQS